MKLKITKRMMFFIISFILLIILALAGTIMSQVNEPKYNVISFQKNIEIREYVPLLVAQVAVTGERKSAISSGFKILADYIFGNNKRVTRINRAAPAAQQDGERISMTAPVIQQESKDSKHWNVAFVMPEEYSIKTLPQPKNKQIEIISIPRKRYVVIRFSGLPTELALRKHQKNLINFLAKERINARGKAILALYNPPWTLPFLRRNEIMFEIEQEIQ